MLTVTYVYQSILPFIRFNGSRRNYISVALFVFAALAVNPSLAFAQEPSSDIDSSAAEVSIELVEFENHHVVEFNELPESEVEWIAETQSAESKARSSRIISQRYHVVVSQEKVKQPTAMMGSFQLNGNSLTFRPRFPFRSGTAYRAKYLPVDEPAVVITFSVPDTEADEPTRIIQVYPSSNELPENLLKFYVHFSAPMARNDIYRFMRIEKEDGSAVELPFLEIDQQLWSRDGKRLTLLLDPGRIKRGLKPREEMGPILEEGQTFRLVFDADWLDANGNQLVTKSEDGKALVKTFSVGPPDDEQPSPANWKLSTLLAGTKTPLTVTLDEPCDSALLKRLMTITPSVSDDQAELAGSWRLGENETSIAFTPDDAWKAGEFMLHIPGELEDLCGNSVERQFDVDLFDKTEPSNSAPTTSIEFNVTNPWQD